MLRDVINLISGGFEKIELTADKFSALFSKPMGVEEAKAAFEKLLDNQCAGKNYEKARIIYR